MKTRDPLRPPPASSRSAAQRVAHGHAAHPAAAGSNGGAPFDEEPAQRRRIAQLHAWANRAGAAGKAAEAGTR